MGEVLAFVPRRFGKTSYMLSKLHERRKQIEADDDIKDFFLSVITCIETSIVYHGKKNKGSVLGKWFTYYKSHNPYCSEYVLAIRRANWYYWRKHKNIELYHSTQLEF